MKSEIFFITILNLFGMYKLRNKFFSNSGTMTFIVPESYRIEERTECKLKIAGATRENISAVAQFISI